MVGGEATELCSGESCLQSEVTILYLRGRGGGVRGGPSSSVEELKDIVMHISLSRNKDFVCRLYQLLLVSPVSVSPPFPN